MKVSIITSCFNRAATIRGATEGLTLEQFQKSYGNVMGAHYYGKWCEFKFNIFRMIRYFNQYMDAGQTFCTMLMAVVEDYEEKKRNKSK